MFKKSFFKKRPLEIAPLILGSYLAVRKKGKISRFLINEIEVYDGEEDLANHASSGKTERTKIMYEEGGVLYVYIVYGMHYMLNIVTGEGDYPSAILIRGVEGIEGPGRLTKALGIDKSYNGLLVGDKSGVWIEKGLKIHKKKIKKLPRVGVDYAGAKWSKKPFRYLLN